MAAVLAAGKGNRMDRNMVKQYMEIGDKPLVAYTLEMFEVSPVIDEIILMIDTGHMEYVRAEIVEAYGLKKMSTIGTGGDERYESVWKAPCTLIDREEGKKESVVRNRQDGYIFFHDGAHLFVTGEIIERTYRAARKCNTRVVGMPVKDTIKPVDQEGMTESSPDRSMVWQAQTSQVFSVPLIVEALTRRMKEDCTGITDDAMAAEVQVRVRAHMVVGSYISIKIMTPEDLLMTEVLRNSIV